jgi:hypothetical protein
MRHHIPPEKPAKRRAVQRRKAGPAAVGEIIRDIVDWYHRQTAIEIAS